MPVSKTRKLTIKQAIREARLAETVVPVCLRADLAQAMVELETQKAERLAGASESLAESLAGPPDVSDLDTQIADLQAKQAEHTFDFRLRELSYQRWDKLEIAHPARDGKNERLNLVTFLPALIRASVVEPQLDPDDWDMLLGRRNKHPGDCRLDTDTDNERCTCLEPVLSKAQFQGLADTAAKLNTNKDSSVPFSLLVSMLRQLSSTE